MVGSFPSERTLEIAATQQQEETGVFDDGVVFAPTQSEEAILGFDIGVKSETTGAVEFGFQYKAIRRAISGRKFEVSHPKMDADVFPFYSTQAVVLLATNFFPRELFYALPTIPNQSELEKTLDKTLFIDVLGLYSAIADYQGCRIQQLSAMEIVEGLQSFSLFYVTRTVPSGKGKPAVYLKEERPDGAYANPEYYHEVPQRFVHSWDEIAGLGVGGYAGVPVARGGTRTAEHREWMEYLARVEELFAGIHQWEIRQAPGSVEIPGEIIRVSRQTEPITPAVKIRDEKIEIGPPAVENVQTLARLPTIDELTVSPTMLIEAILAVEQSDQLEKLSRQLAVLVDEDGAPLAGIRNNHRRLLSVEH